jgi:uncharacterized protein DUF1579
MADRETASISIEQAEAAQQPPAPDPALKKLDRYVGTWDMTGRTIGSDTDNVKGRTKFEWLPGGFFLQQRISLDFAGYQVEGLELIGYDAATGKFPSTVYSNGVGEPLPYWYEVEGDKLKIRTDLMGATFEGEWSADGKKFSGGWRPDPGKEGGGNIAYDIWGERAKD